LRKPDRLVRILPIICVRSTATLPLQRFKLLTRAASLNQLLQEAVQLNQDIER
jgi:hypothetical protein